MPKGIRHHIRTVVIAGLLVIIPIWITFMLLQFLAVRLDGVLGSYVPEFFKFFGYQVQEIPGLGIIIMIVAIYFIGLLARNLFGRQIVSMTERVLGKVPIVRTVYLASKQLLETVALQQGDGFKRVVLIEYPRRGVYCLAFVTSEAGGEVQAHSGDEILNVFVPTTPNPTSGYLVFLSKKEMIPLEMSIEEGIKYVVSGGFVVPPYAATESLPRSVPRNGESAAPELPSAPTKEETRAVDGEEASARQ